MRVSILILLIVNLIGVYTLTMPFSIAGQGITAQWEVNNPTMSLYYDTTTVPTKILELHFAIIKEVHYPVDLDLYSGVDYVTAVNHYGEVIQTYSFDKNESDFSLELIDNYNQYGIKFIKQLDNLATWTTSYTMNRDEDLNVTVPRGSDDEDCSMSYLDPHMDGCTCNSHYIIPTSSSVKFTVEMDNWPFAPLTGNNTYKKLIFIVQATGPFDIPYYFSTSLDLSKLLQYQVCDLGVMNMIMTNNITVPFKLFSNALFDGEVVGLGSALDLENIVAVDSTNWLVPFEFLAQDFNHTLYYDPDLSVLFNTERSNDIDGSGSNTGGAESGVDNDKWIIPIAVILPIVFVVVVVVIIVVAVVAYLNKRKLANILQKSSSYNSGF